MATLSILDNDLHEIAQIALQFLEWRWRRRGCSASQSAGAVGKGLNGLGVPLENLHDESGLQESLAGYVRFPRPPNQVFPKAAIEMGVHATDEGGRANQIRSQGPRGIGVHTPHVFGEAISLHARAPF
jgi:hypothetical protein